MYTIYTPLYLYYTAYTAEGNEIRLKGLGTFKRKETAARKGRNPKTGMYMYMIYSVIFILCVCVHTLYMYVYMCTDNVYIVCTYYPCEHYLYYLILPIRLIVIRIVYTGEELQISASKSVLLTGTCICTL